MGDGSGLTLLRTLPGVLSALEPGEFEEVSGYLEEVALSAGEKVLCEDVGRRSLAFIVEGTLEVMKETDFPGKHVVLAVLHPGAVVGEVGSFGDNCHALTAVAVGRSRLALLSLDALDKLSANNPKLGVKILKGLLGVTAKRLGSSYQRLTSVF